MSKNHRTSAWKILFARSNGRLLGTEVQNVKTKMLDIAAQACVYTRLRGMRNPNVESLIYAQILIPAFSRHVGRPGVALC